MTLHLSILRTGNASGNEVLKKVVSLTVDGFVVAQSKQKAERKQPALED